MSRIRWTKNERERLMNMKQVKIAKQEAARFLAKVKELEQGVTEKTVPCCDNGYVHESEESRAVRRASMDLTRALADMRC